ncbi:aspartate/glutamate racemase family protein [Salipiger sp.]|uniref:aspartate/glutamate racemase family protein n=1 Tax=Salipiger sp. TaxID=2078585 RepID=UPI003A980974
MTGPILFINPNSSRRVTDGMAEALAPLAPAWAPGFECLRLEDGPPTIATDLHVAEAAVGLARLVRERPDAAAYVVACFSDPGLEVMRSLTDRPVLGFQQAGVMAALARADQFGIISLGPASKARHRLRLRQAGVMSRFVGSVDLGGVSAEDVGHDADTFDKSCAAGQGLVALGADVVVLGCAGFAPQRRRIEEAIGVPVIDPVIAAAGLALAACL